MHINERFGKNVRQHRVAQRMTQEQLSEKAELHRTYVSGLERGVCNPSLVIIHKIANALQIDIKDLF